MLFYTGKVHVDIVSVALGNHILDFICASKHGDGSLEWSLLRGRESKMF